MGRLDPPELRALAQFILEQSWLDMRVLGLGLFERVRIDALVIRRDDDELVVVQQWLCNEGLAEREHVIRVEDVVRCKPTIFTVEDVTPWVRAPLLTKGLALGDSHEWLVARTAVCFTEGVTEAEMAAFMADPYGRARDAEGQRRIDTRHLVVLVMYEISTEPDLDICRRAGWKSVQPMLTARWKFAKEKPHGKPQHGRFARALERAEQLGGVSTGRARSLA